jgi:fumarate hydratase subunit alpha
VTPSIARSHRSAGERSNNSYATTKWAAAERRPVCQDSGVAVVMLDVGQDVHWIGGGMQEAVYEGVRDGTRPGYLRWSVTGDPTRMLKLSGQETPAVIHVDIVPGSDVKITFAS